MKASLLYFTFSGSTKKGDYGSKRLTNCDRSLQFEGLWEQKNPALRLGGAIQSIFHDVIVCGVCTEKDFGVSAIQMFDFYFPVLKTDGNLAAIYTPALFTQEFEKYLFFFFLSSFLCSVLIYIDERVSMSKGDHHTTVRIRADVHVIPHMHVRDMTILIDGSVSFHGGTDVSMIVINTVPPLLIQVRNIAVFRKHITFFAIYNFNFHLYSSSCAFSGP